MARVTYVCQSVVMDTSELKPGSLQAVIYIEDMWVWWWYGEVDSGYVNAIIL